ncbi:MAG: aminopeptidase [Firmicutes bacterium]|nr:aminopeptidase [Bacillota bacterium]
MNETGLKKYAELLVRAGGNVQKGQLVVISCSVDNAPFGRLVRDAAYDAGASEVRIDWSDETSGRALYLRGADEVFDEFPQWRVQKYKEQDDKGAVYLHILSSDPDNLAGVDPNRLRRFSKVANQATKEHSTLTMSGALRWSIVATPSPKWAAKVFPDLPEAEATERLWEYILKAARADGENAVADWEIHDKNFIKRVDYLNKQQFAALRFTTGIGTDLTLGLVKDHVWAGGSEVAKDGVSFFPNIPTEEIFTMPHREKAEGRVVASMPLSYQSNLIEGFEMTFKDGKVVSYKADKGQEILKNIVEMDDGAARLGEVAIVANSSPIGQMNTLFYNTLFDENASAHLALGKAYPKNMAGGNELTLEERVAKGGNDSLIHVDFMFGTADMRIVGIKEDGTEEVFFDKGEFV